MTKQKHKLTGGIDYYVLVASLCAMVFGWVVAYPFGQYIQKQMIRECSDPSLPTILEGVDEDAIYVSKNPDIKYTWMEKEYTGLELLEKFREYGDVHSFGCYFILFGGICFIASTPYFCIRYFKPEHRAMRRADMESLIKDAREHIKYEPLREMNEKLERENEERIEREKRDREIRNWEYRNALIKEAEEELRRERIERYNKRYAEGRTIGQITGRNKWNIFPGLAVAVVVILLIVLT